MTIAWYDPTNHHVSTDKNDPAFTPLGQLWPLVVQQERNFCPRCGKRTKDLTVIHTCTPPAAQPPQRTWVGLTDEERINISYKANGNECVAVELTESKLKEKNI